MEADWEVEIGGDSPVIEAQWPGFVDLRSWPTRISELKEPAEFPAMAEALLLLNSSSSPVGTSKCDVWDVDAFDPDELDAPSDAAESAVACYVDLLTSEGRGWPAQESAVTWCMAICRLLRIKTLRCCRVDMVIRKAWWDGDSEGLGITTYITSCGPTKASAVASLAAALGSFAEAVLDGHSPIGSAQSYNKSIVGE
jgi:hypothetical protein